MRLIAALAVLDLAILAVAVIAIVRLCIPPITRHGDTFDPMEPLEAGEPVPDPELGRILATLEVQGRLLRYPETEGRDGWSPRT